MAKNNYENYTKEQLIAELKKLSKRKKYGLVWEEEKTKEKFEADAEGKLPVLVEDKKREIITNADKPTNILIEGDNYHALSVLNYTHAKSIDVIYIDQPYNTGNNDFRYNDKYIEKEDSYRHSKWLAFINKRLKLAKNLLKDTGMIFISIDDNEIAQLKMLCDEIFLEENFLALQIWRGMHTVRNSTKDFNHNTEYIATYAKNVRVLITPGKRETYLRIARDKSESYPHDDNDGLGKYKLDPIYARNFYTPYEITFPNKVSWTAPRGNYPRYSKLRLLELYSEGKIVFTGKDPKAKRYLKDVLEGVPPNTLLSSEEVGFNKDATIELFQMFDGKVFDQPKPTSLIQYLLSIRNSKINAKNITVLDFMAGSGSTAQAVLELNKEDGGNRQVILCTNNENEICTKVCYPRIKKVIQGYKNSKGEKVAGLGGNLKYYKTDFVGSEPTHRNKRLLTDKSIEMLCIKENTFYEVLNRKDIFIFKSIEKFTAILFDEMKMGEFKNEIKKLKMPVSVYVFSLEGDDFKEEFENLKNDITLCSIPEAILKVYRRIYGAGQMKLKSKK